MSEDKVTVDYQTKEVTVDMEGECDMDAVAKGLEEANFSLNM